MKAGAGAPTFLAVPGAPARGAHRARALHALGLATFWHESPFAGAEASRACFEEAVDIYRELGDDRALAAALRDLGGYWKGAGDAVVARMVLGESVAIAERIGDDCAVAAGLAYLGVVAAYTGAAVEARDLLERALAVLRERGGTDEVLRCAFFLACLDCDAGETATARARFQELLSADVLTAMPYSVGFALDGLARLAAAESQPHRALRLTGAARAAHERVATSAGPAYDAYVRRGIEPVRTMLSPAAAQRAVERGRAMTLHEAMAEGLGPVPQTSTALAPHEPLSAREAEVLHLAAEGLADADIAGRLHLSRRTVGNHLSSTYRKLGVGTRTAAIREARELGLL